MTFPENIYKFLKICTALKKALWIHKIKFNRHLNIGKSEVWRRIVLMDVGVRNS